MPLGRAARRATGLALIITAGSLSAIGTSAAISAPAAAAADSAYTASFIPTSQQEFATAVNPDTGTVYLGAESTDYLSVVDGATGAVTDTLNLGAIPRGIAVDPSTGTVYVTLFEGSSGSSIDVIDGATNTITKTISQPGESDPAGIAVDPKTGTLYEIVSGQVDVIDGATGATIATVGLGGVTAPFAVAFDQSSDVAWVAAETGYAVAVSGATESVVRTVSLSPGDHATSIAADSADGTVYVGANQGVIAIDGATGALTSTIPTPGPADGVAVDPATGTIYATGTIGSDQGQTWVINSGTISDTINRGGFQAAIDTATGALYMSAARATGAFVMTPSAQNAMSPIIDSRGATFTTGVAGSFPIIATAQPAAEFSVAGVLPAGISLSPAGVFSGTPAPGTGGLYPVTVTARNGVAPDYQQPFTITVDQAPQFSGAPTATFQVGTFGSYPIQVTGYPAPNVQAGGQVPAGLTVVGGSTVGWALSGRPAPGSGGVYDTSIYGGNSVAGAPDLDVTVTVNEAPAITSVAHVTFRTGVTAEISISGDGYPKPAYSETGKLPGGVTLASNGLLSGKPTSKAGGKYSITVTARNAFGSATQAFMLTVDQAPAFTSSARATFKAGSKHTFTFRTSGYPAAKLSRSGKLPKGVTFKAGGNGTATLTGKPPRADRGKTYVLKITASNGVGAAVHQTFRLKIS